ncbi:hypothetical protein ACFE04_010687 [Oxalis oulophora]
MLQPKEADIPALFFFLVVLPLVAYILLGKWSEASKRREKIDLLAHLAAEEALRADKMATAGVIPVVPPPNNGLHHVPAFFSAKTGFSFPDHTPKNGFHFADVSAPKTGFHFADVSPLKNGFPFPDVSTPQNGLHFSEVSAQKIGIHFPEVSMPTNGINFPEVSVPSIGNHFPDVATPKNGLHVCARCFGLSKTRCSRCKSVRYCSGKCQIIHWRQVHKFECQQSEITSSCSSMEAASVEDSNLHRVSVSDSMDSQVFGYNNEPLVEKTLSDDNIIHPSISSGDSVIDTSASQVSTPGRKTREKRNLRNISSKEAHIRHKSRVSDPMVSEEAQSKNEASNSNTCLYGQSTPRSSVHEVSNKDEGWTGNIEPRRSYGSSKSTKHGKNNRKVDVDLNYNDEVVGLHCSSELKVKSVPQPHVTKISKSSKSTKDVSGEQSCPEIETKGDIAEDSKAIKNRDKLTASRSSGVAGMDFMKMMGLRKSTKVSRQDFPQVAVDRHKKIKMLFPYEEFVKLFHFEVLGLLPRGLLNCGNSCYANAVLQCLTCTKPLIIYLLHRSHSRTCCGKDWCLMCELEQHVFSLRESGGPLSPSRILSHMRSINSQIGDGSQEDAHEFLRLLVASMQAICLEGLGGEKRVDPRLQETTFIQHTFGGRLCSKVKCLRCHHESERYEKIMDLTLEIYGWVESLEDALTQFTTPEDLDGENMYRCGRCAAYVPARKQLSIHEAPNILTIVLKRFEKGRYGKINKCITFPDMLDMVPFMTGKGDIPPLYTLYAVVVHLDNLNASFSGHYVSYVKDLQGNWFRIDDTQVISVPMSQVMSEEAYILFYTRSSPRPQRSSAGKPMPGHILAPARKSTSTAEKHSQPIQHISNIRSDIANGFSNGIVRRQNQNTIPIMGTYSEPISMEFSDATSSDNWSLFTSSDEASFTTESTRDSFSTIDYSDDPVISIFNNLYAPESSGRPRTRFVSDNNTGYVQDSGLYRVQNGKKSRQVSESTGDVFVNYGKYGHDRTYF